MRERRSLRREEGRSELTCSSSKEQEVQNSENDEFDPGGAEDVRRGTAMKDEVPCVRKMSSSSGLRSTGKSSLQGSDDGEAEQAGDEENGTWSIVVCRRMTDRKSVV